MIYHTIYWCIPVYVLDNSINLYIPAYGISLYITVHDSIRLFKTVYNVEIMYMHVYTMPGGRTMAASMADQKGNGPHIEIGHYKLKK